MPYPDEFRQGIPVFRQKINENTTTVHLVGPDSWFKFKALSPEYIGFTNLWLNGVYQNPTKKSIFCKLSESHWYAVTGIKLNSDYAALLTDDPEQWASLLQAVEDHRHKFPDFFKAALAKSLTNYQIDYLRFLRCLIVKMFCVYIISLFYLFHCILVMFQLVYPLLVVTS